MFHVEQFKTLFQNLFKLKNSMENLSPEKASQEIKDRFFDYCEQNAARLIFINPIDKPFFLQNENGEDLSEDAHNQIILGSELLNLIPLMFPDLNTREILDFTFDEIVKEQPMHSHYAYLHSNEKFYICDKDNVAHAEVKPSDILNIGNLLKQLVK